MIKAVGVSEEPKWVTDYNNHQKIVFMNLQKKEKPRFRLVICRCAESHGLKYAVWECIPTNDAAHNIGIKTTVFL